MQEIEKYVKKGNILDVGSAFGFFLNCVNSGWKKYGIELAETPAEYSKRYGINIQKKGIEEAEYKNDFFDVITMIELIEHLPSPIQTLSKCSRIMKKNGLLVVQTGNVDCIARRVQGPRWHYYSPEHLFYYSLKNIKILFEKTGFKLARVYYGDEFGLMLRLKSYWISRDLNLKNFINFIKYFLIQSARRIHLASLSMGGFVIYARKI